MIKDLSFDLFDKLNKVSVDKFGRVNAFLAFNKPIGITSHDLVDQVRKKLGTKKVGHAGALDPFASGVMLVLVGTQYTRLAEDLIMLDKSYRAKVLFGITTDSLDAEGKITGESDASNLNLKVVQDVLKTFEGEYDQFVPVFSSVKVKGNKLRVLARKSKNFEFFAKDGTKYVRFNMNDDSVIELELPRKKVKIWDTKYLSDGKAVPPIGEFGEMPYVEVEFACSKGTYVRQFAYDLAQEIDQVGMLFELSRTRIGSVTIDDCMKIEDLKS